MIRSLFLILLLSITCNTFSQRTDFIVLKKKNNRTLRTYSPGTFISAETYNGFAVHGYIKSIRNDSIIVVQQDRQLVATEFGSAIDTISYTIGINYREIKKFYYTKYTAWGHKTGFLEVKLPKIMMIGGAGFIFLELINSAYRKESLSDQNKIFALGIAASVAATGLLMQEIRKGNDKVGGKYKVVYTHINDK
jgi:hypothetical protein